MNRNFTVSDLCILKASWYILASIHDNFTHFNNLKYEYFPFLKVPCNVYKFEG